MRNDSEFALEIKETSFSKDSLVLCGSVFLLGMLAYGYNIFNFTLNIDAEFKDNFYQTVALGRWAHAFMRELFLPEPFTPYFTNLVSIGFLCGTALVIAHILKFGNFSSFLFCALFVSFPQLSYQFEFINQADTLSVGYLFSALSVLLFLNSRKLSGFLKYSGVLVACAFYVLAMAVYQTLAFVPPVIFMARLLVESYEQDDGFFSGLLSIVVFGVFSLLAGFFYALLTAFWQSVFNVSAVSQLLSIASFQGDVLSYLYSVASKVGQGLLGANYYGFATYALATLCAVITLGKCFVLKKGAAAFRGFLVVAILLFPYLVTVVSIHGLPPRIFVVVGLSFAVLIANELRFVKNRHFCAAVVALIYVINVSLITKLFYSDAIVREADVLMANRIKTMMMVKYPDFDETRTPVYFHGGVSKVSEHKLPDSEIFGSSFFSWDGGNNYRILAFFDYYGIADFKMAQKEEVAKVKDELENISRWPGYDAIELVNGVMVVKLGDHFGWLPFDVN